MSDNAYINDLEDRLAEAESQLAAANATVAACKAAGFIDAEGRVRKVLGEHTLTKDGAIVSFEYRGRVYHSGERDMNGDLIDAAGMVSIIVVENGEDRWRDFHVTDCYSTPVAAKEAQ